MKKICLFLIIFLFMSLHILRAEEIALTLDEAIAIGLRDNRNILLKAEDIKKAKEKIKEAKASLWPSLTFTGGWSRSQEYYYKDISSTTTQFTVKQDLFKGGKIINTIKYNEYGLEVIQALLDKEKLETVLDIEKAFYTLLLSEKLSELNKAIVDNTRQHLDLIQARYANGEASESDVLKMESSLSNVNKVYESSFNQVEASQSLLRNLLFLNNDVQIKTDAELTCQPREVAFDEGFLKAMEKRPEIRQYKAQEEQDKKQIEIVKADNRPNIYASWDYYSRSHTTTTTGLVKGWNDHNVIGITVSWPIFDGWATRAKVEQALIDLKKTQLTKEKLVKDIALELRNAYLDLKNAIAKINASESDILFYQHNLATARDKYKQGELSLLEQNDAELKYAVAIFNKKQAIYDYLIAKSSFEKATGGL